MSKLETPKLLAAMMDLAATKKVLTTPKVAGLRLLVATTKLAAPKQVTTKLAMSINFVASTWLVVSNNHTPPTKHDLACQVKEARGTQLARGM